MLIRHTPGLLVIVWSLITGTTARGQYNTDYQTNTISSVSSNWSGDYYVGSNQVRDVLIVQTGGLLSDAFGIIGYKTNAQANSALITGSGTTWDHTGSLYVGYYGAGNSLTISNGGAVHEVQSGYLGYSTVSSNNFALITGTNSIWRSDDNFFVGVDGAGNSLTINDGGKLANGYNAFLGYGASGRNNTVVITDAGSSWNNVAAFWVGFSSRDNSLIISNGGTLSSSFSYIGGGAGAISNRVVVTGTDSRWRCSNLYLEGPHGRLIVDNGGFVDLTTYSSGAIDIGGGTSRVAVVGSGSVLAVGSTVSVGISDSGNSLLISNGGLVRAGYGAVGVNASANSNSVWVANSGSVWSNVVNLDVGVSSVGNRLVISNGGVVYSGYDWLHSGRGSIGYNPGASDNIVTVVGPGSAWENGNNLLIGYAGSYNKLIITNGARADAANLWIGYQPGAVSNTLDVFGSTLVVSNETGTGLLDLRRGRMQVVDSAARIDNLMVTNDGSALFHGTVTLNTRTATLDWKTNLFLMGDQAGATMRWTMLGGSHALTTPALVVGASAGATGVVSALGADFLLAGLLSIGSNEYGQGVGSVVMTGRVFRTRGFISGYNGSGVLTSIVTALSFTAGQPTVISHSPQSLVVGASVLEFYGVPDALVDWQASSLSNITWTPNPTIYRLNASTNAMVSSAYTIGAGNPQGYRTVEMIGGSAWRSTNLEIGTGGILLITNASATLLTGDNQLVVTAGGRVVSEVAAGGFNPDSSEFTIVLGSSNALWTGNGDLTIGYNGSGNQLIVTNGGIAIDTFGYLGFNTSSRSNRAVVAGAGSLWSNRTSLAVGYSGSENYLALSNGATVVANGSYLGYNAGASNNAVHVSGPGSLWKATGELLVGHAGSSNSFMVSNGGSVVDINGYIGFSPNSSNNNVVITGNGSVWNNSGTLSIGYSGTGNSLTVSNLGAVSDGIGIVGYATGAAGNRVLFTGSNSVWNNQQQLYVGYSGAGNSLIVSDGAVANTSGTFGYAYIGNGAGASNNSVAVQGNGSLLNATAYLYVGNSGSRNNLTISGGAAVSYVFRNYIGFNAGSNSNSVFVAGSGSSLRSSGCCLGQMYVGNGGSGNQLVVSDGGLVYCDNGFIGANAGANSNQVLITGSGSIWTNTANLTVGGSGTGNLLMITSGGTVAAPVLTINSGNSLFASDAIISVGILTAPPYALTLAGSCQISTTAATMELGTNGFVLGDAAGKAFTWGMNGGSHVLNAARLVLGGKAGASGQILAKNSDLITPGIIYVGSNLVGSGTGSLVISNGILRSAGLVSGWNGSGTISNFGGLFMFNTNAPTVTANTPGSIVGVNAGVGFDGITDAPADLTATEIMNIDWQGGVLRYRLTNATNAPVDTFTFGLDNPQGTRTLEMVGGATAWQGTNLVIGTGGTLLISNTTASVMNTLTVTNGGRVLNSVGAGGFNSNNASSSVLITGSNSFWSSSGDLSVGYRNTGNVFIVNQGGVVTDGNGYVGHSNAANYGRVVVSDAGSIWSNRVDMFVGYSGSGNQLVITNQGAVSDRTGYVGFNSSSTGNVVTIQDWAAWNHSTDMYLGYSGAGNQLNISGGGALRNNAGYIGANAASSNNQVLLSGTGSTWINQSALYVGYSGRSNNFTIANGAILLSGMGYVGVTGSSSNNTVFITDNGSRWSAPFGLTIGYGSTGNRVILAAGGQIIANSVTINNLNTLSGCGTVTGNIFNNGTVNATCSGGTLTFMNQVINSGTMRANAGGILEFYGPVLNLGTTDFSGGTGLFRSSLLDLSAPTNSWIFSGSGLWTEAADWSLGQSPAQQLAVLITNANSKTVTLNASVLTLSPTPLTNYNFTIAAPVGSTNTLVLDHLGPTSPFVAANMTIGARGQLVISNSTVRVGIFGIANLILDGALCVDAGVLEASPQFLMGQSAPFGSLVLTNGGVLRSTHSYVGYNTVGSNNLITVSGPGSSWSNTLNIYFGNNSRGNQLVITNDGLVRSGNIYLGYGSTSLSNRMTVAGGTLAVPGILNVLRGILRIDSGTVTVNTLQVTTGLGSVVRLNGGWLSSAGTMVTNSQLFVVGDGTNSTTFKLEGGVHSFASGLRISSNAVLTGCGIINGNVTVAPGGQVIANCGGQLVFNGSLTNAGTLRAVSGTVLEAYGPVVNLGILDALTGGTNFHSTFVNQGVVTTIESIPVVSSFTPAGGNMQISFATGNSAIYAVEYSDDLSPGSWVALTNNITGTGGTMTVTDLGVVGLPHRYYRVRLIVGP